MPHFNHDKPYGVKYTKFAGREGRLQTFEKHFSTQKALDRFVEKIQDSDGFKEFLGWRSPKEVNEDPTGGIVGGLVGLALGAKGAYNAAKKTPAIGKDATVKNYVKNFAKGIVDPRTYIPSKKGKEVEEAMDSNGLTIPDSDSEEMQEVTNAVTTILTKFFGGKAWFKAGGYAYLMDVTKPNVMKSSDGANIKIQSFAHGIDDYADKYVADDFFQVAFYGGIDKETALEFFRPVKASPMMKDGGPKWGTEQERHELDQMGLGEGQKIDRFARKWIPGQAKKQINSKIKDQQASQLIALDGDANNPQNQKEISQTKRNIRRLNNVGEMASAGASGVGGIATGPAGNLFGKPQRRVTESDRERGWLADSILYRIERQKPELFTRYGVEYVTSIAQEVGDSYESWFEEGGEIGSSDISALVKDVERQLVNAPTVESKKVKASAPIVSEGRVQQTITTPDWHIIEAMLGAKFEIVDVMNEAKGLIKINESAVAAVRLDAKTDSDEEIKITIYRNPQDPNKLTATLGESDEGISAKDENKFHEKLDNLVHDTFGHSKKEKGVKEGATNFDADAILDRLSKSYYKITRSDAYSVAGKSQVRSVYELLREPLMKEDEAEFSKMWSFASGKYPDAFDELCDDVAELYIGQVSETELTELDNGPKGRVNTDNIKYGQTRSLSGYGASKEELAQRRATQSAAKKEKSKAFKAAMSAASKAERAENARLKPIDEPEAFKAIARAALISGDPDHFTEFKRVYMSVKGTQVAAVRASVMSGIDFERDMGLGPDEAGHAEEIFHYIVYRDPEQPRKLKVAYSRV